MHKGYGSLSVCLSVSTLTATQLIFESKVRYHSVLHGVLKDFHRVDFADNALFKSFGVIRLSLLPSTLPDELSTDRRNSSELFSR